MSVSAWAGRELSPAAAENIALSHAGLERSNVTMKKTMRETQDGRRIFKVGFFLVTEDYIDEHTYRIDANTGMILRFERDRDLLIPQNVRSVRLKKASAKEAVLSWSMVREADGYILYRFDPAKSAYTKVGSTQKLTYRLTGLKPGRTYTYCVKAYIVENGKKNVSREYSPVTFTTRTASPKDLTVTSPKKGSIAVNWTKSTGAVRYEVQCSTVSDFSAIAAAKTVKTKKASFSNLKKGAKVYIRVFAFNKDGVRSAASAVKAVTVKK